MYKDHFSFWQLLFLWHCAWPSYQHTSQNVTSPRDSNRYADSRHCSNHKSVCRWQPAEKLAPTSFSSCFLLSFSGNTWKGLFNHRISERFCNHSDLLPSFTFEKPNPHSDKFFSPFFLFPQRPTLKTFEDLAKLYISQSARHHFLCNVTLDMENGLYEIKLSNSLVAHFRFYHIIFTLSINISLLMITLNEQSGRNIYFIKVCQKLTSF